MQWSTRFEDSMQSNSYGFIDMRPHKYHTILVIEDHNTDLNEKN
jgi:hypothetical protein